MSKGSSEKTKLIGIHRKVVRDVTTTKSFKIVFNPIIDLEPPFLRVNTDFWAFRSRNDGPEIPVKGLNFLEYIEKSLEI